MEKTNQKMPAYMPMYEQDDEIDFLELWEWIWTQKLLIMGVMILAMMGAGVYLKVATPIYEAEVFLSAPLLEDLVLLNQKDVAKGTTTPDGVFQDFLNNLLSKQGQKNFKKVMPTERGTKLDLKRFKKNGQSFVSVTFQSTDAEQSAEWVNGYVKFVTLKTKKDLAQNFYAILKQERTYVSNAISSLIEGAVRRRLDRVTQLEEALEIAQAAGIHDWNHQALNELKMEYMRGTKAITREIELLKIRKSDAPFIDGLHELQEKLLYLNSIKLDEGLVHPVRIDEIAVVPKEPIKPRKIMILVLAFLFGGLLGVFCAFIKHVGNKRRLNIISA
jgi:chain length determinant protein (polysaccharide antigen chain regulator)